MYYAPPAISLSYAILIVFVRRARPWMLEYSACNLPTNPRLRGLEKTDLQNSAVVQMCQYARRDPRGRRRESGFTEVKRPLLSAEPSRTVPPDLLSRIQTWGGGGRTCFPKPAEEYTALFPPWYLMADKVDPSDPRVSPFCRWSLCSFGSHTFRNPLSHPRQVVCSLFVFFLCQPVGKVEIVLHLGPLGITLCMAYGTK